MSFLELVKQRSSVRKYDPTPVPRSVLESVLETARLAPSWANKQCWHFIVVTAPDGIKHISRAAGKVNSWLKRAPAVVVACGDPSRSGTRDGKPYYLVDVAIAMEHLVLAAAEQGLGSCWLGFFDEAAVKNLIGIPDGIEVVALTPLGHPAPKPGLREKVTKAVTGSKKRKALDEIVHWEHW